MNSLAKGQKISKENYYVKIICFRDFRDYEDAHSFGTGGA
jgi:hypothetical protein